MIIVKITSGLGNQLFQFFTAYKVSLDKKASLFVDSSSFKNDKLRKYELENLELNIPKLNYRQRLNSLFMPVIKDKQLGFDPSIYENNSSIILDGYWQSPKYFNSIKSDIKNILFVKKDLHRLFSIKKDQIIVSIHIRRGDYVNSNIIFNKFELCTKKYYENAIVTIEKSLIGYDLHFLIFSDDVSYSRNLFEDQKKYTVIDQNKESPLYDLNLMANCSHNITANSTFSWWGAWLNPNINKIVVTPKEWYKLNSMNQIKKDLIPNDWIEISNK
jgi:hypothetical protein